MLRGASHWKLRQSPSLQAACTAAAGGGGRALRGMKRVRRSGRSEHEGTKLPGEEANVFTSAQGHWRHSRHTLCSAALAPAHLLHLVGV